MVFYAVVRGHVPGIYTDWDDCKNQINGFVRPLFMKFSNEIQAENFFKRSKDGVVDKRPPNEVNRAVGTSSKQPIKILKKEDGSGSATVSHESDSGPSADKGRKRAPSTSQERSVTPEKRAVEMPERGGKKFHFDESGNVTVYTAGYCPERGEHAGIPAFGVFFGLGSPLNYSGSVQGKTTNHTANIKALTHALKAIKGEGFDQVVVSTSSLYVINSMTHFVYEYKIRDWQQCRAADRANKEILLDLDRATQGLKVQYKFVKGRSGDHAEAYKLARRYFGL